MVSVADNDGNSGENSHHKKRGAQEIGEHLVESPNSNQFEDIIHDMMSPAMGKRCSIMKKFASKKPA